MKLGWESAPLYVVSMMWSTELISELNFPRNFGKLQTIISANYICLKMISKNCIKELLVDPFNKMFTRFFIKFILPQCGSHSHL